MLLVSDSGSTKADWQLADKGKIVASFTSIGFNPFFHDADSVYNNLINDAEFMAYAHAVSELFFFGSGCSHPTRNKLIEDGLKRVFPSAKIFVGHDLDACAYATCGDDPGIACILGTGSNSCYFDGKVVHEFNHGLGYILGDEGSGSYFGKKLLAYSLYKIMPADLQKDFEDTYHLTKEIVLDNVYNKPNPNVFMASYSKFLSKHPGHPYIKKLLSTGFGDFLDVNVCNIPESKNVSVHFIGSLAYNFSDLLKEECAKRNLQVGNILQKPIDSLMQYFLKKAE